ncbi:MAG: bifunctional phosphoglucose/phosphomannose isomerase [Candidatus Spechtbacterales bacterium]
MSMYEAIKNFPKQFEYEPRIENGENLKRRAIFIVAGMGGSHLAGDIVQAWSPSLDVIVHSDYGISRYPKSVLANALIIASSYSGNTEETISAFREARDRGLDIIVISTGGKLIELAKEQSVPYIEMPDTGIQPRSALGFSFAALLKAIGEEEALAQLRNLATLLDPEAYEDAGRAFAEKLKGKVPVIYSSRANQAIAYNWKIKFNETGKIPAFYNVFPELNHNEMTGFDVKDATKKLSESFYFFILRDTEDHPSVIKGIKILERLYKDRGLSVEVLDIEGQGKLHKIFSSLILADWIAYYTAEQYGLESEQVPMVEEFKKLIAE